MIIEQELIKACIAKNRAAQQQLYLALLPYLRAVTVRYLRDNSYEKDALQEAFVKIFRSLKNYNPAGAPLKNWAARIVINTCLNYNERVLLPADEYVAEVHEPETDTTDFNSEQITDERMLSILKRMPKGSFAVFNLFVIDEYSHKEIAEILRISPDMSRQTLSRAKKWLRKAYESAGSEIK